MNIPFENIVFPPGCSFKHLDTGTVMTHQEFLETTTSGPYQVRGPASEDWGVITLWNPADYLAAIFRILIEWDNQGRQRTDETRHDFIEWTQTLDWIVQNLFHLAPLIDDHVEEVLRVSDPALSWLRLVAIAVHKEKRLDEGLSATEIVDICLARGVELPGVKGMVDQDQLIMYGGRLLNRLFRDAEEIAVDRYKIRRDSRQEYNHVQRKNFTKHYYWFERR